MPDPCVFCEIVAGRSHASVVREWDDALAFVPRGPVVEGHVLVIPKRHVANMAEDPAVSAVAMRAASELAVPPCNIITSAGPEATQTVYHLHLHVVPRRANDGLALPWAPGMDTGSLTAEQARAEERARIAADLHHLGDWPDGYSAFRAFVERHGLVYPGERPIFSALLLTLADLIRRGEHV